MGVEVDVCAQCRGVWFDAGEIPDYIQSLLSADSADEIPAMSIDFDHEAVAIDAIDEPYRTCPRCVATMYKHNYAYDSNVILDACSQCMGHWADGDEVLRLATHKKGNPRIDQMARSMTDHNEDHLRFRELASDVAGLGGHVSPLYLVLPKIILPLYDDVPAAITPWVTMTIIATNLLVMGAILIGGDSLLDAAMAFALHADEVNANTGGHYGLTTYMFLHAGILHLIGNMLFLWIFGDNIEEEFGHAAFFGFYILSGVVAGFAHLFITTAPELPLVGASGAVAGVMGAYFVFHPTARIKTFVLVGIFDVPAVLYLIWWFALQSIPAFLAWGGMLTTYISHGTHVAGFVAGASLALLHRLFHGQAKARRLE